jgi:hypothetical protein
MIVTLSNLPTACYFCDTDSVVDGECTTCGARETADYRKDK